MTSDLNVKIASLYDTDYQVWLNATVEQLRTHDFSHLDLDHLIEEMESLGKRDRRAIASYLTRLCEHLLKLMYWESERALCFRGWRVEVRNFRLKIQAILHDSPSLRSCLQDNFLAIYQGGRNLCLDGSGLAPSLIPQHPAFTLEQALAEDWLPWQPQ